MKTELKLFTTSISHLKSKHQRTGDAQTQDKKIRVNHTRAPSATPTPPRKRRFTNTMDRPTS